MGMRVDQRMTDEHHPLNRTAADGSAPAADATSSGTPTAVRTPLLDCVREVA